jgi:spermidine/putrescine transport system substrate-binding protein
MPDRRTSRRTFLGASAGLAATGLAACGGVKGTATESKAEVAKKAQTVDHPKTAIADWTWSNWPLYIDKKVLKTFDKRYGGHVKYLEDINDNFDFFGKVRQQLEQGQSIGRDLVVLTDYMAARWIRSGYAEPIDKRNVPNAKNLVSNLQGINYDPQREYSLPWQSGVTGIGYNIKKTGGPLHSVKDLFDPKYKGRVTFISEPYDAASLVLLGEGIDCSKATIDQLLQAIEKIDKANRSGQIRRFTGNDYTTDLAKGNVDVVMGYSGDLIQLQSDNPNLRFCFPEEGSVQWTDNMMIPAHAEHPYAAETMMNFVYEPQIAAKIAAYVNYVSPVKGAKDVLLKTDPGIAKNPLIFPPDKLAATFRPYPALSSKDERTMQEAMAKVTGA